MKARDVRQLYQDRYAGERLIKVVGESPVVKNIAGRHGVDVGGFAVHSSGKRVVLNATIDNLLKGAATQCLRKFPNMLTFWAHLLKRSRKHEPCSRLWGVRWHST
jgi:N-acetyl-gamma-glutamyl-phosphate reductase / acetylglutamate kinase